jgi:hypothetical protein
MYIPTSRPGKLSTEKRGSELKQQQDIAGEVFPVEISDTVVGRTSYEKRE